MFESTLSDRNGRVDWSLVAAVLALMTIGAAFIYSASFAKEAAQGLVFFKKLYVKQLICYGLGVFVIFALCSIDYRTLARWSLVGYWGSILLLLAVPFVGMEILGAKRWINIGFGFTLQPSELAKIAFIFAMANYLSRPQDELRQLSVFLKGLAMTAIPFVIILKEPDLGSALVFFPITFLMMFVAGVPRHFLINLIGGIVIIVSLILVDVLFAPEGWYKIKLHDYQRERLLTYFGVSFVPKNATPEQKRKAEARQRAKSYNVDQALISVGSGGLTGKGWRQGTQYSLGFLPPAVAHNDFIFSVIAEEEGFVGSVVVVTLYTVILFSGINIAGQARDRLGKLLAVGVVAMLFSHVFINIGMNIRLMPVTGIPLPLLSYGGSSVLCSLIAIGILQNVYMYRKSY